jgi:hypothetical protein
LLGLQFNPEDDGNMLLQNVGLSKLYSFATPPGPTINCNRKRSYYYQLQIFSAKVIKRPDDHNDNTNVIIIITIMLQQQKFENITTKETV